MKLNITKSKFGRRLLIILAISFGLSLALELYVFGFPADFFSRWLRTLFVVFALISGSVLVIIPLVSKFVNRWVK